MKQPSSIMVVVVCNQIGDQTLVSPLSNYISVSKIESVKLNLTDNVFTVPSFLEKSYICQKERLQDCISFGRMVMRLGSCLTVEKYGLVVLRKYLFVLHFLFLIL